MTLTELLASSSTLARCLRLTVVGLGLHEHGAWCMSASCISMPCRQTLAKAWPFPKARNANISWATVRSPSGRVGVRGQRCALVWRVSGA